MKLAYVCKYTPVEILEAMGFDTELIEPDVVGFTAAETAMHPNMCSYVKGVMEKLKEADYDGVILTTCCDSMRRLKDVAKHNYPNMKIYSLDLPRKLGETGESLYFDRVNNLINELSRDFAVEFEEDRFLYHLKNNCANNKEKNKDYGHNLEGTQIEIGILGGRIGTNSIESIINNGFETKFNLTCTGDVNNQQLFENIGSLREYTNEKMRQFPCMRMDQGEKRRKLIEKEIETVDGLIYHNVQFCDMYSYEYTSLRKSIDKPILRLDTDLTPQSKGQIKTRVEAFYESLEGKLNCDYRQICQSENENIRRRKLEEEFYQEKREKRTLHMQGGITENKQKVYVLGIDSGSTSTNAVIMDENGELIASSSVRTGAKASEGAKKAFEDVLDKAKLNEKDISRIVSTGYGRDNIKFKDRSVTEITCHGRGAHYFFPQAVTVLDIGGQDSKAIKLDRDGNVVDFAMNDKCAAGTGRFLEAIARTLEIPVTSLEKEASKSKNKIEISSMCTVFAESEVISLIAEDVDVSDIAAGVSNSIAGKAIALMKRIGLEEPYMMTGGVARNGAVVKALSEISGGDFLIPENPDLAGAVGAALFAIDDVKII